MRDITSIDDLILMPHSVQDFSANIKVNFSITSIEQIITNDKYK